MAGERDLRKVNETRSVALHRLVGERLGSDPALIEAARKRVVGWLGDGSIHRVYGEAWLHLLSGPLDRLQAALIDPSDHARALRQCSPFAGVVDAKARWRIWREGRST